MVKHFSFLHLETFLVGAYSVQKGSFGFHQLYHNLLYMSNVYLEIYGEMLPNPFMHVEKHIYKSQ
jgi:hypothetical protein